MSAGRADSHPEASGGGSKRSPSESPGEDTRTSITATPEDYLLLTWGKIASVEKVLV